MEGIYSGLNEIISRLSLTAVFISSVLLILLTTIAVFFKRGGNTLKIVLFSCIVLVVILCTLFLAGSTIYLNVVSSSGGPVHHHADFEIYKCNLEVELKDPEGLSNKIGTATFHEHNDKRIHIEGVIVEPLDASLGNFFRVVGGSFEEDLLTFPINDGQITLQSGDECASRTDTKLQIFLYEVERDFYGQRKLENPKDYTISPEQNVPPGDCIIIELDVLKEKTDKICRSFEVAIQTGELSEFKN